MNYHILFLLYGALAVPVIFGYPPGSCDGYTNITDAWRNFKYTGTISPGFPNDDAKLVGSWWRFTGIGGDKVVEWCVGSAMIGGTQSNINILPGEYPTAELETPVTADATGFINACSDVTMAIDIVLCPGGFFIYRPNAHSSTAMGYITMHSNCGPDSCGPLAQCTPKGGCVCGPGVRISKTSPPTPESFHCEDKDECLKDPCGPFSNCTNIIQSYSCMCIEGYKPPNPGPPAIHINECIDIDECLSYTCAQSIGTLCTNYPGTFRCGCDEGYAFGSNSLNFCVDINECATLGICGIGGVCMNLLGSYNCVCVAGYAPEKSFFDESTVNNCIDIDECEITLESCGPHAICRNFNGTFNCSCEEGFVPTDTTLPADATNICIDFDDCGVDVNRCGELHTCYNFVRFFNCSCLPGYQVLPEATPICQDIDECDTPDQNHTELCGPIANCTNLNGSYSCACDPGYEPTILQEEPRPNNTCIDINECLEIPPRCGQGNPCFNEEGTFQCFCAEGFYPSTGIVWEDGITVCKQVQELIAETPPLKEKTKRRTFLIKMLDQLRENNKYLRPTKVKSCFAAAAEAAGIGPHVESDTLGSHGDGVTGSILLAIAERLVARSNPSNGEPFNITLNSSTLEMSLLGVHESMEGKPLSLSTTAQNMDIHLEHLDYKGYAPAAFLNLKRLDRLLSHEYFETEKETEMFADVFTAFLPMNTTNLTVPINFTIQHEKTPPKLGMATCVFWEDRRTNITDNEKPGDIIRWSEEGCWVSYSDENHTVCSCSHLSTFALIMQIGEPPPESDFLEWLNRVCVAVGLFFFALAILTFLLCSWNPKINNTARLHLCITLGLSHLLLLWNDKFVDDEVACTVMAGITHFLVVASFMWMLLEAVQLYMLVRRLSKVQVIQKDGLSWPLLYLIGYVVPFVIIGVSALVYADGYGPTEAGACWLSRKQSFNWALTGPVIAVLVLNFILFMATLWSLRPTLANMKSGASKSQETKIVIFKIVAQFIILGCTWILGLYQTNVFFQFLFIVLNSQQGTFLYIVHCLLNKEVREEYIRWLSCLACKKREAPENDLPSVSENIDKVTEKVSK